MARRGRPRAAHTMLEAFRDAVSAAQLEAGHVAAAERWPSAKYQAAPVAFAREVLGIAPWSRQVEILEAVRDNKRVAVASGHKVSKSHSAAIVALWFYCSFEDARVVMTSTTSRQVDQILWRELRMLRARARRAIDGEMHELARSGFKSPDFREIVGFTAREAEAVAGVSGKNLLYIPDEASGISDAVFEAIEGNRAGGARICMFSNPTRTEGEFFEAFHGKKDFYKLLRISSEESPNVVEGREVIPGLATRDWIEEKKREWGVDSAMYKVRIKGEFVLRDDSRILSIHDIAEAEKRWAETPADGPLRIGLDPAGDGGQGDESVFAPRRGLKILALYAMRGLTEDGHLAHLLGIIARFKIPGEPLPRVVIDREGAVGARIYGTLRSHLDRHSEAYELVGVRGSDAADGNSPVRAHDRVRDKLWDSLRAWFRDGGAIPEDTKLARELHAPEWFKDARGRDKVTSKDDLRKKLGRSPDRGDAVCLAVWEPRSLRDEQGSSMGAEQDVSAGGSDYQPMDPYAGLEAWRR